MCFLFETDEHVVTEQQVFTDLNDVSCYAIVFGANPRSTYHLHVRSAKLQQTGFVDGRCLGLQLLSLGDKALADDFVSAALGYRLVNKVAVLLLLSHSSVRRLNQLRCLLADVPQLNDRSRLQLCYFYRQDHPQPFRSIAI